MTSPPASNAGAWVAAESSATCGCDPRRGGVGGGARHVVHCLRHDGVRLGLVEVGIAWFWTDVHSDRYRLSGPQRGRMRVPSLVARPSLRRLARSPPAGPLLPACPGKLPPAIPVSPGIAQTSSTLAAVGDYAMAICSNSVLRGALGGRSWASAGCFLRNLSW